MTQPVRVSGNGFPKNRKLVHPAQFRQVFQKNERSSDRYWTLLFCRNEAGCARLGMAVAKKKAKRAVDRNRLKRVVRESFRARVQLPDIDIVVLPREASVTASNEQLRVSLDRQWSRIETICAR